MPSQVSALSLSLALVAVYGCSPETRLGVGHEPTDAGNVAAGSSAPTAASDAAAVSGAGASGAPSAPRGPGDAGRDDALSVRVQDLKKLTLATITLACAGDCADIEAVASGGHPPYAYAWEDGNTNPQRHVCFDQSAKLSVSVTDTGIQAAEFGYQAQTTRTELTANVIGCAVGMDAKVYWADWSSIMLGTPGSAAGVMSPPNGAVTVSYAGEVLSNSMALPSTNDFLPETTYLSTSVANGPAAGGMIAVAGQSNLTQTITFSKPVRDPLLALWSLGFGSLGQSATLEFDAEPTVLSVGVSTGWPFSSTLTASGRQVTGVEGNGVIQFAGTFSQLSFTVPKPEMVPGYGVITVGMRAPR